MLFTLLTADRSEASGTVSIKHGFTDDPELTTAALRS